MARFDVYRSPDGHGYVLDVQADLLSQLNTRAVVPLLPPAQAPLPARRLNPEFEVGTDMVVMVTQFIAAIPVLSLQAAVGSLAHRGSDIINALEMLITGF